jgi:metal-responsive CopG/Arc/MetJ family transcriptional regulator
MTEIITFSIKKELREKVDRLRGKVARSKFISEILESAFKSTEKGGRGN